MTRRLRISDSDGQITYLYCTQIISTIVFLAIFCHISYKVKNLQNITSGCNEAGSEKDLWLDNQQSLIQNITKYGFRHILLPPKTSLHPGRVKHKKRNLELEENPPVFELKPDTIIPLQVLQQTCDKVHEECSMRGRKLRGYPGRQGHPGSRGRMGKRGRSGRPGVPGARGPVGEVGEQGPHGRHGRCNCTLPDLYIKKILIPGPPVIQFTEVVRTVPVIIIKEVIVGAGISTISPPIATVSGRPSLTGSRGKEEISGVTQSATTKPETTTLTTTTTTEPWTGPPTLGTNKKKCLLDAVGIPVLHAESQYGRMGSWMRDPKPPTYAHSHKRWVTDQYASAVLYEYKNEHELLAKQQLIKYYVNYLAAGTGSVVYKNSYFYHRHNSNRIVRYDLNSTENFQQVVANMAYADCQRLKDESFVACNKTDRHDYLYNQPHNFVDFAVDENGLWFIHRWVDKETLVVKKIEPLDKEFYLVSTWNIDVNASSLANTFIMCGVLYGLEKGDVRDSRISFAYDLYEDKVLTNVSVPWYNPYQKNTMLDYNPIDRRLYFYDAGRLLSVNVRTIRRINGDTTAMPHFNNDFYD